MLQKKIPEEKFFHVDGGPVLPSLLSLRIYLRTIPYHIFAKHVNEQRNDFASWVEDVFEERGLASKMRLAKSREQMVWAIDDAFSEERMQKVIAEQPVEPLIDHQATDAADAIALQEDANFDRYKGQIAENNERVSAKYEEIARNMQQAIANIAPKEVEQRAEKLKSRYMDLLGKISETRRLGRDMLIPALLMREFLPKLAYAISSREEKDFAMAQSVLDQAETELREIQEKPEKDLRKEVLAMAGIEQKKVG